MGLPIGVLKTEIVLRLVEKGQGPEQLEAYCERIGIPFRELDELESGEEVQGYDQRLQESVNMETENLTVLNPNFENLAK